VLYFISKAFWLIAQPPHLMILLVCLGMLLLFTGRRRLGLGLVALDALLLLIVAVLPVGSSLIAPLETRFPPLTLMPAHVDGVIMLGGNEDVAFTDLAQRYPNAKLVFTGGSEPANGAFLKPDAARKGSRWMGIDTSRITFVRESRNTFEDVLNAKAIVHPTPGEVWILVTSAFHMPRSVGLFRAQGWRVMPDPVDYLTGFRAGKTPPPLDFRWNLTLLSVALKEWIGMCTNWLLGHSESLFPGPR
jgi:uncharacterized SAM-binding protein YcdF (DUF218 family)